MPAHKPEQNKRKREQKEKSRWHKNRGMTETPVHLDNYLPKQGHKTKRRSPVAQGHDDSPKVFLLLQAMNPF